MTAVPDQQHIRLYVKEWREKRGYSLAHLAAAATIALPLLDEIERGVRGWNSDQLKRLAEALRCEPADLLREPPLPP